MAKEPWVIGLVLCQRMVIDPAGPRLSLEGVFHLLAFDAWPAAAAFTAYAALQGGQGEGTIELRVTRLEDEQDIYRYQRWVAFADPTLTVQLEISVRRCVFPAPGRYGLSLDFDGASLSWRVLDLLETRR